MALVLYHAARSRSIRPLWLLEEMGLDYELRTMTYDPEFFDSDAYHRINPMGKVPTLYDGDQMILESTVMMEYILVKHGPSPLAVLPEEKDYAVYLTWFHMAESGLSHYLSVYGGQLSGNEKYAVTDQFADYAKYQAEKAFAMLDERLEGRTYLAADRFTAADISVGFGLFFGKMCRIRLPEKVDAYYERLKARPAWQKIIAIK